MLGGIASGTNITLRQGGAVVVRGNTLPSQRTLHPALHTVQANCVFVYSSFTNSSKGILFIEANKATFVSRENTSPPRGLLAGSSHNAVLPHILSLSQPLLATVNISFTTFWCSCIREHLRIPRSKHH